MGAIVADLAGKQDSSTQEEEDGTAAKAEACDDVVLVQGLHCVHRRVPANNHVLKQLRRPRYTLTESQYGNNVR